MSVCSIVSITETSNCQFSTQYVPWIGKQIFSLSGLQRDGNASIQFGVHQLTLPLQYIHSIYTYRMISDSHETAFLSRLGYDSKALFFFLRDELRQQLCWCENKGRAPRCSYSIYCKSIEFHRISLLWVLFGGTIGQFQNPSCFMTIIWGFIHPLYLRNDHNPWVIGNPLLSNNKREIVQ